jgi:cytolethal distending toxin subunit B
MPNLVTWNLQGSSAATEVKWQSGIANLANRGASVICLQECGARPPSATDEVRLAGVPGFHMYHWGTARTRKYISHYLWDASGNRCNLAIVSLVEPTNVQCCAAAGDPAWRPAIGVQINGCWYFCLHAISPGGADAAGLLAAATANSGGAPWFVAGDFNREPAPALANGTVCPPDGPTYPTASPRSKFDYMYTSGWAIRGTVLDGLYMSDHLPVWFKIE